jgi:hypothetical protein
MQISWNVSAERNTMKVGRREPGMQVSCNVLAEIMEHNGKGRRDPEVQVSKWVLAEVRIIVK